MDNPYLQRFSFLTDHIHRANTHVSGHSNTLLIASLESMDKRIWFEAALAWEIAEQRTFWSSQLSLGTRISPILDPSNPEVNDTSNQLLSIALITPTIPEKNSHEFAQWHQKICSWFEQINQGREAIARQSSPILLWISTPVMQDFVQHANDLWSWRSGFLDISFPRTFVTELLPQTNLPLVQALSKTLTTPIPKKLDDARRLNAKQIEMATALALDIPEITALQHVLLTAKDDSFVYALDEQKYLQWLIEQNEYLDPRGTFQTQRQVQLKLDEIYIGLRAQADERPSDVDRKVVQRELAELDERLALSDLSAEEQEDRRDNLLQRMDNKGERNARRNQTPIPLTEATANHERLVILGDPGSGKTTLLRYLAYQHAKASQAGRHTVSLVDKIGESEAANAQSTLFPILIRIADYAENGAWKELSLSDFLPNYYQLNEYKAEGLADLLTTKLKQGGCLVLLDGLDEIVDADDRRGIVQKIEDFVHNHDRGGPNGSNRFIITSRIAGYRSAPLDDPFAHFVVEDMDDSQIQHFLERWCRAVEDTQTPDLSADLRQSTTQREVDAIMGAIRGNPGVRRLASNPLMLRTLALIHRTGARLPQKRIELYKLAADTLARTWRTAQGVPATVLVEDHFLTPMLGQLAYWMHEHKPTGIATEREVYEQLGSAFAKRQRIDNFDPDDPSPQITQEINSFLLAVREHTGLFVERAPKRYGFMHLTFEEYYAARHLVANNRKRASLIRQHLHDPRWQEPILLALGFVGLDYPRDAEELFETAILAQGEEAEELGFTPSKYEDLLGRDYLFALRALGDQIPANPITIEELAERLATELTHQSGLVCYHAYQTVLNERVTYLAGSNMVERVVAKLFPLFNHDNRQVRSRAASSLELLGKANPDVVNALLSALKDDDGRVRYRATSSLGQLGEASPNVVNALIFALKDDDGRVRYRAASSLGQLGEASPNVVNALISALKDDDGRVRARTASSLGQLGEAKRDVINALISALKDHNVNVRCRAASSLGQVGEANPDVINALISTLNDDDGQVRYQIAKSLGQVEEANPDVINALISALKDDDGQVRYQAAWGLGQQRKVKPDVVTTLISTFKDDDGQVRYQAAKSLTQLGKVNPHVIIALISALKNNIWWQVRSRAAKNLVQLGKATPNVINALISTLKDDNGHVRYRAAKSLAQLGKANPDVVNALLSALKDDDFYVRYRVALSLVQLGEVTPDAINALISLLKDDDGRVPSWAASSLGQLGKADPDVINALISALKNNNAGVRSRAASSLVKLGEATPDVINALISALMDDNRQVRSGAAWSLVKLGEANPDVINALISDLTDADSKVVYRAALSLGKLSEATPDVTNALISALTDADSTVRSRAALSLVKLGEATPDVINALISALKDADPTVRRSAAWHSGNFGSGEQSTLDALRNGLLDSNDEVRAACAAALAEIGTRFPDAAPVVEAMLVDAIMDPAFEARDKRQKRTAQDYAHEALWQLVNR